MEPPRSKQISKDRTMYRCAVSKRKHSPHRWAMPPNLGPRNKGYPLLTLDLPEADQGDPAPVRAAPSRGILNSTNSGCFFGGGDANKNVGQNKKHSLSHNRRARSPTVASSNPLSIAWRPRREVPWYYSREFLNVVGWPSWGTIGAMGTVADNRHGRGPI
jgi:hypothetical protein